MSDPELPGVSSKIATRPTAFVKLKSGRKRREIIARHQFGGAVTVRLIGKESDEFLVHQSEIDFRDHSAYMRDKSRERMQELVRVFREEMSGMDLRTLNAKAFPKLKLERVAMMTKLNPRTVIKKLCEARKAGLI